MYFTYQSRLVDLEANQSLWRLKLTNVGSSCSDKNNGNTYYKYKLLEKKSLKINLKARVQ